MTDVKLTSLLGLMLWCDLFKLLSKLCLLLHVRVNTLSGFTGGAWDFWLLTIAVWRSKEVSPTSWGLDHLLELFLPWLESRILVLFVSDSTGCDWLLEFSESLLRWYGHIEFESLNIIQSLYDVTSLVLTLGVPLVSLHKKQRVHLL